MVTSHEPASNPMTRACGRANQEVRH